MAIDTAAKRNAALIDVASQVVLPDDTISASDRWSLVGQYFEATLPATVVVAFSNKGVSGGVDYRLAIRARGTQAFRLNVMSSVDDFATYEVVDQVQSSTVHVDGGTAGYTEVAEIVDYSMPSCYRIELETDAVSMNYKIDAREVMASR